LPETAKRNDRDWRLSSHHEAKYYKIAPARASHCMRFWQHWSRHCQRRNFRNTCVRRNIIFRVFKNVDCFMSLRRHYSDKAVNVVVS